MSFLEGSRGVLRVLEGFHRVLKDSAKVFRGFIL